MNSNMKKVVEIIRVIYKRLRPKSIINCHTISEILWKNFHFSKKEKKKTPWNMAFSQKIFNIFLLHIHHVLPNKECCKQGWAHRWAQLLLVLLSISKLINILRNKIKPFKQYYTFMIAWHKILSLKKE